MSKKPPGRPKLDDLEKKETIKATVTRDIVSQAKLLAKERGISFSALVEQGVRAILSHGEK